MQTFKLTPKPESDFRLEINAIRKVCRLEKCGYRHDKIVYGFCDDLTDIAALQAEGLNIELIPFDAKQFELAQNLIERGRAKSKIEHLQRDLAENGANNASAIAAAEQRLTDLNDTIQAAKDALGITGTIKTLKL